MTEQMPKQPIIRREKMNPKKFGTWENERYGFTISMGKRCETSHERNKLGKLLAQTASPISFSEEVHKTKEVYTK